MRLILKVQKNYTKRKKKQKRQRQRKNTAKLRYNKKQRNEDKNQSDYIHFRSTKRGPRNIIMVKVSNYGSIFSFDYVHFRSTRKIVTSSIPL